MNVIAHVIQPLWYGSFFPIQVTSVSIKLDEMNELNTISFLTYPHLHDKHLDRIENNKRIVKVSLVLEHSPSGRVVLIGEVSFLHRHFLSDLINNLLVLSAVSSDVPP